MQELLGTLLLLAALAAAGYLVWVVSQPHCPRCGKRLTKREVEFVGGCLSCYEEIAGDDWMSGIRTCRVCGCTDLEACPGGCYWVEDDLCSRCVEEVNGDAQELHPIRD